MAGTNFVPKRTDRRRTTNSPLRRQTGRGLKSVMKTNFIENIVYLLVKILNENCFPVEFPVCFLSLQKDILGENYIIMWKIFPNS